MSLMHHFALHSVGHVAFMAVASIGVLATAGVALTPTAVAAATWDMTIGMGGDAVIGAFNVFDIGSAAEGIAYDPSLMDHGVGHTAGGGELASTFGEHAGHGGGDVVAGLETDPHAGHDHLPGVSEPGIAPEIENLLGGGPMEGAPYLGT